MTRIGDKFSTATPAQGAQQSPAPNPFSMGAIDNSKLSSPHQILYATFQLYSVCRSFLLSFSFRVLFNTTEGCFGVCILRNIEGAGKTKKKALPSLSQGKSRRRSNKPFAKGVGRSGDIDDVGRGSQSLGTASRPSLLFTQRHHELYERIQNDAITTRRDDQRTKGYNL